tara:strand:- start:118 stop:231 length:114 start_codon:yes stop_codon:yes gene_type:complete
MKVGMILLPGVNDKAYKAFIETQKPSEVRVNPNLNQW